MKLFRNTVLLKLLKKVFLRVRDDGRFVYSKGYTTVDVGGSRETLRKHENILVQPVILW